MVAGGMYIQYRGHNLSEEIIGYFQIYFFSYIQDDSNNMVNDSTALTSRHLDTSILLTLHIIFTFLTKP